jgi:hypothetical protein
MQTRLGAVAAALSAAVLMAGCGSDAMPGPGDASGSQPLPDAGTPGSETTSRSSPGPTDSGVAGDGSKYPIMLPDGRIDYDIRPPNPRAPGLYRVVATRNIAAPGANPSGITFDGKSLWVMFPYESNAPLLVQYDPDRAMVTRQVEVKGLAATPKLNIYGIAWDGQALWVSAQSKIVQLDLADGSVRKTFSSPADLGPSDLDFDGTNLWLSTGTGDIFLIDRANGGILRRFVTIQPSRRDQGIAWRPNELWVGGLFGGLDVHDPATGAHIGSVIDKSGQYVDGAEFGMLAFAGDQLIGLNRLGITYYQIERLK